MNIIVTGVSRGLGLIICQKLLERGDAVFGISRHSNAALEALEKKYPDNFRHLQIDLSNPGSLTAQLNDFFNQKKIRIDGLVNNAALGYDDLITNLDLASLEEMFAVNVYSPMILSKYAIRNMLLHHTQGSIVHVSSVCAHTGYKGLAFYASTKGALEAFSKNMAREWGGYGIRSNVVVPGFMETDMTGTLSEDQKKRIYSRTALKEATSVDSVADTVLFLMSGHSVSLTGQNIHVDSGTI